MQIYAPGRRLRRFLRDFSGWSALVLAIVLFMGLPIYAILAKLLSGPGEIWPHIAEHLLPRYTANTLIVASGCLLLTFLIGVAAAWASTRYDFAGRRLLQWGLVLPLAMPSYITAYAYAGLFGFGGSLDRISQWLGLGPASLDLMNIYGLIWVLSISLFPYVYVSTRAVFVRQSQSLLESARLLGASEARYFFTIALPLARPAIVGGLLLVVMEVLNDYGAAKYFGISTFTTGIFRTWFGLEAPEAAVYLSAILVLIVFVVIALERWQRRRRQYANTSARADFNARIQLSGWKALPAMAVTAGPVLLGFVLPCLQLGYWASLTFSYPALLELLDIAWQSLALATAAAALTTGMAFFLLYFSRWNRLHSLRLLAKSASIGYTIPGAVIAIGVMIPTLALDQYLSGWFSRHFDVQTGLLLNGTGLALVYAYVVRFLMVAQNPLEASALKAGPHLPESSYLLGASRLKTLARIELPLLKTGFLSAFVLVFVDIIKELPLTLILKPYGLQTLAVKAYEYASDERIAEAGLPALGVLLPGLLAVALLNHLTKAE